MSTRKRTTTPDAPPLPPEAQPAGSGAVPGSAQGAEEMGYTGPGARAVVGEQVQPGVNDGMTPDPGELQNTEADTELAAEAEEPMVTFLGKEGKREMTSAQWAAAGVPDMPTVVWERRTGHQVPKDVFSPKALQVLRQDGHFRIS